VNNSTLLLRPERIRITPAPPARQSNPILEDAKALGDSANRDLKGARKRVLPAAGRAAIAKAAKKRWAKVRSQAKKVAVVATSGEPDCGDYGLGLKRLVSYIQRRLFSGNTPALPNQPADIPNGMAVPKTKTQIHPIRSAVNIKASKVSVRPTLLDARLGLIRATPARIAGAASIVRRKGGRVGFARLLQTGSHGAFQ
jgi:hypothetical protein